MTAGLQLAFSPAALRDHFEIKRLTSIIFISIMIFIVIIISCHPDKFSRLGFYRRDQAVSTCSQEASMVISLYSIADDYEPIS